MPPKRKAATTTTAGASKKAQRGGGRVPEDVEAVVPMGRSLASTEKSTRDAAIRSLSAFLTHKAGEELLPPLEIAKLWQGIFYCFWMSDKERVQQALAQELSELILAVRSTKRVQAPVVEGFSDSVGEITVRARSGLTLLEGFWDTIIREWPGLDKWRINKFYLLIRRFVNASFRLLASEGWDANAVAHFSRLLVKPGGVLCANDPKVPDSMTYHFTDLFLTELNNAVEWYEEEWNAQDGYVPQEDDVQEKASKSKKGKKAARTSSTEQSEEDLPAAPLNDPRGPIWELFRPLIQTAATCHSKVVYKKIMDNILQPLLKELLLGTMADGERDPDTVWRRKICKAQGITMEELEQKEAEEEEAMENDMDPPAGEISFGWSNPIEDDYMTYECEWTNITEASSLSQLKTHHKIFKMIFEAASRPDALPPNRRKLYAMWQEEKDRREEESEDESSDEEEDEEEEDEDEAEDEDEEEGDDA